MLKPLTAAPIQEPIVSQSGSMSIAWITFFSQLVKLVNRPVVFPVSPIGVTPDGETGQVYLTSTGIIATYNGTNWVQYDGTPVTW